ncbi:MAG: hypothetical protein J6T01_04485 [Kiritimatiellae bacterium]|nr:hypothetical protein [Kiritimatiellia bacterium]
MAYTDFKLGASAPSLLADWELVKFPLETWLCLERLSNDLTKYMGLYALAVLMSPLWYGVRFKWSAMRISAAAAVSTVAVAAFCIFPFDHTTAYGINDDCLADSACAKADKAASGFISDACDICKCLANAL